MSKFATYPSLRDRGVLVTGGGSGIGANMVELFAGQGARVAFVDIEVEVSQKLVETLAASCAHAPYFAHCDLTDIHALRATIKDVETRLGGIQVLVNNAANDDRH